MALPSEREPLLAHLPTTKGKSIFPDHGVRTYHRRWYLLLLFALLYSAVGLIINTFGPIAHAAELAFGWTDRDIALLSNWNSIVFVVAMPFCSWLIDTKGLRVSCLLSAFVLTVGCLVRCFTSTPPVSTWLFHVGQILIGLANPLVVAAPSTFSNTWFPPEQRTTATAMATVGNILGHAVGFILDEDRTIKGIRKNIMTTIYIHFSLSLMVLLLLLYYFPAKPPSPPNATAASGRTDYMTGIKTIVRLPQFWLLTFVYAATNGVYGGLAVLLNVDLKATGVDNDQLLAGWISFASFIAIFIFSLLLSALADTFNQWEKPLLIAICLAATGMFTMFSLLVDGVLPPSIVGLSLTYIAGSVLVNATIPIFYELTCDVTYPVGEALTTGVLNAALKVVSIIFLGVLSVPGIGTGWMNWMMVGAVAICVPILIPFKPSRRRETCTDVTKTTRRDSTQPVTAYC